MPVLTPNEGSPAGFIYSLLMHFFHHAVHNAYSTDLINYWD